MADNKVVIEISAQGNAEVQINKVTKAVNDLGTQGSSALGKFTNAFDVFAGTLASTAVTKGFSLVQDAASALFQTLVVDGVNAAIEAEDALNQLSSALNISGNLSAEALVSFQEFAKGIQATTKFEDDAIIKTGALIESLTGLKEDGLEQATLAAANLSAALGVDLDTAARAISKSTTGGEEALKKFGVVVKEGANNAETLANAIQAVNTKFGGAAAAQINTFSGAVTLTQNAFGELLETFGTAIITNQSLVNVVKEFGIILTGLQSTVEANKEEISAFITDGLLLMLQALKGAAEFALATEIAFLKMAQGTIAASGAFSAATDIITFGTTDAGKRAEESAEKFVELGNKIASLENGGGVINNSIIPTIEKLQAVVVEGQGQSSSAIDRTTQSLQNQKIAAEEATAAQVKLAEEGQKLAEAALAAADPQLELAKKQEALDAAFELEQISLQQRNEALSLFAAEAEQKEIDLANKRADHAINANKLIADNQKLTAQESALANVESLNQILENENLTANQRIAIQNRVLDQEKVINQARVQAGTQALNALSSLQNSKSKELAAVGKAAAIAQATISTYQGATGAFAALSPIPFVGPALAAAAAAAIITAGLANVSRIAGTPLATGITQVPPGFNNDTFPARLSSGERVVDSNTNQDLKLFLANSGGMTELLGMVVDRLDNLEQRTIVNIGDREIVNAVQKSIDSGRSLTL